MPDVGERRRAERNPPPRSSHGASDYEISAASAATARSYLLPIAPLRVLPRREPLAYAFDRERRTPEPSSWDNQGLSPRRIGTSEPAARRFAAPLPDARSNKSERYSKQHQKYHLSARLHGDRQTALRVHQCDETPAHAGLRGEGQHSRLRT